ncbi:MAG TPA: chemotaxis protein CheD [Deltaproteobacteria bacterium]|nr:chemotaxis protein CheD [Deltaproteobacteria bacterium]HOM28708.1 chemotaxis protein CheD [Deltaproteobacteria bacterium]HPP80467.1 chemotaxis protein CheD [Deltaproteobacteria bacterium]
MRARILPLRKLETVYLRPGEMYFGTDPARVVTVLGSCISIVMYHRPTSTSSMSHALMPERSCSRKRAVAGDAFVFVDSSIAWMLEQFSRMGIDKKDLEVKIFGGSDMFQDARKGNEALAVGKKNVMTALRVLQQHGISPTAWNVGGTKGRKVVFYTDTGDVFTKFVNSRNDVIMGNRKTGKGS